MNPPVTNRFHGRRQGRPLRLGKKKLLEENLPALTLALPDDNAVQDPRDFFDHRPQEVWLEIGFGSGEHLAELASRNPEVGLIGSEVFLNGIAAFLEHHRALKLQNVLLFPEDVRPLLKVLKPQSLHKVILLFPDPWPKGRHHKRRLIQKEFLEHLCDLLVEGGELRLASDHEDYVAWMVDAIEKVPSLLFSQTLVALHQKEKPPSWPSTRYEAKAHAQQIPCTYFSLIKKTLSSR